MSRHQASTKQIAAAAQAIHSMPGTGNVRGTPIRNLELRMARVALEAAGDLAWREAIDAALTAVEDIEVMTHAGTGNYRYGFDVKRDALDVLRALRDGGTR